MLDIMPRGFISILLWYELPCRSDDTLAGMPIRSTEGAKPASPQPSHARGMRIQPEPSPAMTITITGTHLPASSYDTPETILLEEASTRKNYTRSSTFRGVSCSDVTTEEAFVPVFAPDKVRLRPRWERWAAILCSFAAVAMLSGTAFMIRVHEAELAKQKLTPVQIDRQHEITKLDNKTTIMAANWSQPRLQR